MYDDYESGTDQDTGRRTNWAGTDEDRTRAKIRELEEQIRRQEQKDADNERDWDTHD